MTVLLTIYVAGWAICFVLGLLALDQSEQNFSFKGVLNVLLLSSVWVHVIVLALLNDRD